MVVVEWTIGSSLVAEDRALAEIDDVQRSVPERMIHDGEVLRGVQIGSEQCLLMSLSFGCVDDGLRELGVSSMFGVAGCPEGGSEGADEGDVAILKLVARPVRLEVGETKASDAERNKVTRMMRVEAPRQFLPNVRSSGLAFRLALAKGLWAPLAKG